MPRKDEEYSDQQTYDNEEIEFDSNKAEDDNDDMDDDLPDDEPEDETEMEAEDEQPANISDSMTLVGESEINYGEDSNTIEMQQQSHKKEKIKKRKIREGNDKKKGKKKKKKKSSLPDSGDENDLPMIGGIITDSELEYQTESKKVRKSKTEKMQKSVLEICQEFDLEDVPYEYTEADYQNLTNYKLFSQHIRPLIAKTNPKIAMGKMVTLISAKWREFISNNPKNDCMQLVDDEIPKKG